MMKTKLKIASRLALVFVLCLAMAPPTPFAGCVGECDGKCGRMDKGVRDIAARSVHGFEVGGCCSGTLEEVYPCCNGIHPCCSMEAGAPENGPEFLLTTVGTDHLKILRVFGEIDIPSAAPRKYIPSKNNTDYIKARPSPLYLQNLAILC